MKRSRGFSLIELMIALVLGLILTAGVIRIFVSSKQGYRVQESSGRMQESMRFALEAIGREIRQADFWGAVKPDAIASGLVVGGTPCTLTWFADYNNGLRGYDGATTSPLAQCSVATYIKNSDVLAIRYSDQNNMPSDVEVLGTADPDIATRLFFRAIVGRNGYVFQGGNKNAADAAIPVADGAFYYRVRSTVLSLGVPTTGDKIPSLYACESQRGCGFKTGSSPQVLVEGVEQMQFAFGIDSDGDETADQFYPAAGVAAGDWGKVIAVRVGLVIRGDQVDNFTDTTTYQLPGNFSYTPVDDPATPADERAIQRRVIIKDFQVRNRVRG